MNIAHVSKSRLFFASCALFLTLASSALIANETATGGSEDAIVVERTDTATHGDPIAPVLVGIVVIVLAARVGGHFFELIGQPAVLGELVVGVLLGNACLVGIDAFEFLKIDYSQHQLIDIRDYEHFAGVTIDHFARIGVILLLFQIGLESSVAEMQRVGLSASLVACVGVIAPTALGWAVGHVLLPEHHWTVHMFMGATLAATSVGITARVLQDLKKSKTKEAQIILGAAVIDDVLGLIVLAVAQGIIAAMSASGTGASAQFGIAELGLIVVKAVGFLVGALILGQFISRPAFAIASFLRGQGLLIITALSICFAFAWAADRAGLATIVGAFAAGLILDRVHYRDLMARHGERELDDLVRPIANLLVPIFFVEMGVHVDLRSFADPSVLGLAAVLIAAALIGKLACSAVVRDATVNRLAVGIGMIPRGEVGLIFAAVGLQLRIGNERIIDASTYSALVVMVIVTTVVTPPLLSWAMRGSEPIPNKAVS